MSILRNLLDRTKGNKNDLIAMPNCLVMALDFWINSDELLARKIALNDLAIDQAAYNGDDAEVSALEYKADLWRYAFKQSKKESIKRRNYIAALNTPKKIEEELERCRNGVEGTLHWFDYWAWTSDPRFPDAPALPFKLFEKQVEFIYWLEDNFFLYERPGLVEKSRDMGITWALVCFALKHWRFKPRFEFLVGSRNENEVDAKGHMDTIIEKARHVLRFLPNFLLPEGFDLDKHTPFLSVNNPENGNFIVGKPSSPDFGRSGRYTGAAIDEFASFPEGGYAAHTALSQSTRVRIFISTPKGKYNKFYDLRFNSKIAIFTFHWKDHPWKDERWYNAERRTMSAAEAAQELDLDYEASNGFLVLPDWNPLYHVISWSEFVAFYGHRALDERGNPRIPENWLLGNHQDKGYTEEHRCVNTWAARPAYGDPLHDCVFLYREYVTPVNQSPSVTAQAIVAMEKPYNEAKRMRDRKLSHEASGELLTYEEYGLNYEKWETDTTNGISQLRDYMAIRPNVEHPFRAYLKDENGNQVVKGAPRLFVICENEDGMPKYEAKNKKWRLPDPIPGSNFSRARLEAAVWHYPPEEAGKPARIQRPASGFDDAMATWRSIGLCLPPVASNDKLKEAQEIENRLPKNLRRNQSNFDLLDPESKAMWILTRQYEISEKRQELESEVSKHWRKALYKRNQSL